MSSPFSCLFTICSKNCDFVDLFSSFQVHLQRTPRKHFKWQLFVCNPFNKSDGGTSFQWLETIARHFGRNIQMPKKFKQKLTNLLLSNEQDPLNYVDNLGKK